MVDQKLKFVIGQASLKTQLCTVCGAARRGAARLKTVAAALKKRRCVTAEQQQWRQPCLSCPVLAMMKPLITKLLIQSGD
jgi:hypothetical protein